MSLFERSVKTLLLIATTQWLSAAAVADGINLNFNNADVRAVLQAIADASGLNIVATDSVQGSISLLSNGDF